MVERYIGFVLRHRALVLVACGLLCLVALGILSRAVIGSSLAQLMLGESPAYARYLARTSEFGSDEIIVLAFEDDELLTGPGLRRLEDVTRRLEALPHAGRVQSLVNATRVEPTAGGVELVSWVDQAPADPAARAALLEDLASDRFTRGLLVSADGRHGAVVLELSDDPGRPAEALPRIVADSLAAFEAAGYPPDRVHRAGIPASLAAMIEQTYFTLATLFPVVCLVLLATVWVLFRQLTPVLVSGVVSLVAVLWCVAFSVILDRQIGLMVAIVPAVILIVGFSDVIHLSSAYLIELSRGRPKEEAVRDSGAEVGVACLFTSLTTSLGFAAMSFIPTPAFRQLGIVLGFGVAVALLLAMTLAPVFFSLLPTPRPWRRGATSFVQALLDRLLDGTAALTARRPVLVTLLFAAVAVASAVGLSRLHVETQISGRLAEDHRLRQDERYLRAHFAGTNTVEVYVDAPEAGGLLEPALLGRIADFQERASQLRGVDSVVSMVDLLRTVHEALAGEEGLPETRAGLAQLLLLFELAGGEDLERLVDFERRSMHLSVRLSESRIRGTFEAGERIRELAEETLGDAAQVEVTGFLYLFGAWLEDILRGQRRGLGLAFLTISLVMILALRSLRVGLLSMVPNLLPLLAMGGWLGLTWDIVDSDLMMTAMIAIGIGVDDTIHFLMRYRIESRRTGDDAEAVRQTFHYSGRGILMTTVILTLGFLPFVLSDYMPIAAMGTLLPFCLIMALAGDVLLVPALVRLGWMRL